MAQMRLILLMLITDPCNLMLGGQCDSEFRTINGEPVDVMKSRPWLASLKLVFKKGNEKKLQVCAAAYIGKKTLVTAKHCVHADMPGQRVDNEKFDDFLYGHASIMDNEFVDIKKAQTRKFTKDDVTVHESVDIAIISLKNEPSEKTLTGFRTIDIPPKGARINKDDTVKVGAWGGRCVDPPACTIVNNDDIWEWKYPEEVTIPVTCVGTGCGKNKEDEYFMAGGLDKEKHRKSTCSGDSGSPVVCGLYSNPFICGVTSAGFPGGCGLEPSIFVDVTHPDIRAFVDKFDQPYPPKKDGGSGLAPGGTTTNSSGAKDGSAVKSGWDQRRKV